MVPGEREAIVDVKLPFGAIRVDDRLGEFIF